MESAATDRNGQADIADHATIGRVDTLNDLVHLMAEDCDGDCEAEEAVSYSPLDQADQGCDVSGLGVPTGLIEQCDSSQSVQDDLGEHESFWQYKAQAKGPRGVEYDLHCDCPDPHEFPTFSDPVFDPSQHLVNHIGKARSSDGNVIRPNPRKLHNLGVQVEELHKKMEKLHANLDVKAKREKSRLASKVCRLRRKANNEANKVKYALIYKEHEELNATIAKVRSLIENPMQYRERALLPQAQAIIRSNYTTVAVGKTRQLVDEAIKNAATYEVSG